ncbi:hypothetical protein GQ53DRAFT_613312, partial [Thozetella sp. PMI_491]
ACPFLKRAPLKYGHRCAKYQLSRVRDVKQHLARCHTPERYCQRCLATDFANEESLQMHLDVGKCPRRDPALLDGISYHQTRQLSKKSSPNLGDEDQWFAVWEILFPGDPKPSSAYIDMTLSLDIRLFREYSLSRGPELLLEQVEIAQATVSQELTEQQRRRYLESVISQGIADLFEQWQSTLSTSSSTRSQRHSPRTTEPETPVLSVDSGVAMGSQTSSS